MIRVLLADDEEMIRTALGHLLELEPDIQIVAHVGDGRAAIEAARLHRPDVAVLDLEMPRLDGIQTAAELARALPDCACIILTGRGRPVHMSAALAAGAQAFVVKGARASTLADVIRRVHEGGRYVDPVLAADALTIPSSPLTQRESDVLQLASDGLDTAAIASRLHLARGTVRNLLIGIRVKLDAATSLDAARIARDAGWIR
ncbi:response regulator transcription factor [Microbacterium sp.]|uniref:response regulator transcription factor n=1 Tax=Microbacterium sp. TaxID=51671 RepID=UPI002811367B|nr:response regulator transcription factor [Microbacterium sp.]